MDTRQLAAFCEVVDRKSFSQAAERLGVTQPAVSLQIRSLEKRLGTKLLDLWLGDRDDLCAVGDDYQAIYAFTGATPEYLLALPERFPHAAVVRLEANYRSSP